MALRQALVDLRPVPAGLALLRSRNQRRLHQRLSLPSSPSTPRFLHLLLFPRSYPSRLLQLQQLLVSTPLSRPLGLPFPLKSIEAEHCIRLRSLGGIVGKTGMFFQSHLILTSLANWKRPSFALYAELSLPFPLDFRHLCIFYLCNHHYSLFLLSFLSFLLHFSAPMLSERFYKFSAFLGFTCFLGLEPSPRLFWFASRSSYYIQ